MKLKRNYELFGLHPAEKDILNKIVNKRRNFVNPIDPYFTRCGSRGFDRKVYGVYGTDSILKVLGQYGDPKRRVSKSSRQDVRQRSVQLMKQVCDRDSHFFSEPKKAAEAKRAASSLKQQVRDAVKGDTKPRGAAEQEGVAKRSKKDELIVKNVRDELAASSDLVQIEKTIDQREFEDATNKHFNQSFDVELLESGQLIQVSKKPTENELCPKARTPLESQCWIQPYNDEKVNQFTFANRHRLLKQRGVSNTSVLGHRFSQNRLRFSQPQARRSQLPLMKGERIVTDMD